MLSNKGSNPFTSETYSLGEIGKHDGFKIHSSKVIGSSPIASSF